nr:ribonuclease H-like domain-containing protein [Tanacetum cinerariifolium]
MNGDAPAVIISVSGGAGAAISPKTTAEKITRRNEFKEKIIISVSGGAGAAISPKTTAEKITRRNEFKEKSTLLLAIPDEHLLKFYGIKDGKTLWEDINTRFRGNKESKKMQKTILKEQYENFVASRSEGLDKTYDKFQKHINQLEILGEVISQKDANLKLLRSLPPSWNTYTLIMRNKSDLDRLSMDDLYNNLKNEAVFEEAIAFLKYDVKVRDNSITELKNKLEESLKEKYDLKLKLEKFETSSRNLTNLLNNQLSSKDKTGCSYDIQLSERDLTNKSDVFESTSDSYVNESEEDNNQANDRYKAGEGYHAVPHPYIGNFMPPRHDLSFASTSKTSMESMEKHKTIRPNALIIEDWESDSDDDCEIRPSIK